MPFDFRAPTAEIENLTSTFKGCHRWKPAAQIRLFGQFDSCSRFGQSLPSRAKSSSIFPCRNKLKCLTNGEFWDVTIQTAVVSGASQPQRRQRICVSFVLFHAPHVYRAAIIRFRRTFIPIDVNAHTSVSGYIIDGSGDQTTPGDVAYCGRELAVERPYEQPSRKLALRHGIGKNIEFF